MGRFARRASAFFILLIAIAGSSIVWAAAGDTDNVHLMVGRSAVIDTGAPIARVSLTSPDVADALVTSANELLVNGKAPGTISMFVWNRAGALRRYEIVVQRDLARLGDQLKQLFPGEGIIAHSSGKAVVLSGSVSSKTVVDNALSLAAGYADKKEDVVNLLQVADSGGSNQVMLRVRFAEVSRSALTELGASFFTSPNGQFHNVIGRTGTQQYPAPTFDNKDGENKLIFSDFLNFFLWDFKHDLGTVIKALQTRGLFQSLAEPNLVAESGKEASFLAGGEIPVPIAQPGQGGVSVTVMYKEFGIRLNFTPTINGDRVHLKVRPEVSTLDFANAVTLQGFRIPALSTRRTETELELQNGQTFAIAGLINNQMNKSMQKVPGIGDIPILGYLFRSQAAQKDRTELVVMITPEILPRNSRGVTGDLPRLQEQYLPPIDPKRAKENPPPAFKSPATGFPVSSTPAQPATNATATTPASDAANAAARLQALTPSKPTLVLPGDTLPSRPAGEAAPAPNTTSRPLTREEQAALAKAAKPSKAEQKRLAEEAQRQTAADRERLKREASEAKRQAAVQKAADEAAAKRNAEEARKQAELAKVQAERDKKQQKAIEEAQAKLKAAQAAYEAEMSKNKKQ
jgi:pilus assembly protein CpaC